MFCNFLFSPTKFMQPVHSISVALNTAMERRKHSIQDVVNITGLMYGPIKRIKTCSGKYWQNGTVSKILKYIESENFDQTSSKNLEKDFVETTKSESDLSAVSSLVDEYAQKKCREAFGLFYAKYLPNRVLDTDIINGVIDTTFNS